MTNFDEFLSKHPVTICAAVSEYRPHLFIQVSHLLPVKSRLFQFISYAIPPILRVDRMKTISFCLAF